MKSNRKISGLDRIDARRTQTKNEGDRECEQREYDRRWSWEGKRKKEVLSSSCSIMMIPFEEFSFFFSGAVTPELDA